MTQDGFRKHRSTTQAIHCVRRTMEKAEREGSALHIVLLDWEKAFDKITHSSLIKTLERFGLPAHILNVVKSLYTHPRFRSRQGQSVSGQYEQHTGIRQGCPLSPYLFLAVMTAIWKDVHALLDTYYADGRRTRNSKLIDKLPFTEALYVDGTVLLGHTRSKS